MTPDDRHEDMAQDTSVPAIKAKRHPVLIIAAVLAALLIADPVVVVLAWASGYPERMDHSLFSKYLSSGFIKWLVNDADLGLFTFKEFTRAIGSLLDAPTLFLKNLCWSPASKSRAKQDTLFHIPAAVMAWRHRLIIVLLGCLAR